MLCLKKQEINEFKVNRVLSVIISVVLLSSCHLVVELNNNP